MQCGETKDCPARVHTDIPCWEISEKFGTGQSVMNICSDCIVHIVKTNDPILTLKELDDIMEYRNMVKQVDKCPVCKNPKEQIQSDGE